MGMKYLYWSLLLVTCSYALWRGRGDERVVAATCLLASLATRLMISPLHERYEGLELGLLAVDLGALLAFLWIALRSERFWPLWIAGLQLTSFFGHLLKAIKIDLGPLAYGAALAFWSYPILLILIVGTWRGHQRRKRELSAA